MSPKPSRDMYLVGHAGRVFITCWRGGCMVGDHPKSILVPVAATPRDVDALWMKHRTDHASLPD